VRADESGTAADAHFLAFTSRKGEFFHSHVCDKGKLG
jgi:hypothetical protein